jgi:hypothetical protein
MLFKNQKRDRYRITMGPRALTASSGLAQWSMVWIVLRQRLRKIQPLLGCLPPWGREGVTLAISATAKKNS